MAELGSRLDEGAEQEFALGHRCNEPVCVLNLICSRQLDAQLSGLERRISQSPPWRELHLEPCKDPFEGGVDGNCLSQLMRAHRLRSSGQGIPGFGGIPPEDEAVSGFACGNVVGQDDPPAWSVFQRRQPSVDRLDPEDQVVRPPFTQQMQPVGFREVGTIGGIALQHGSRLPAVPCREQS